MWERQSEICDGPYQNNPGGLADENVEVHTGLVDAKVGFYNVLVAAFWVFSFCPYICFFI